MQIADARIDNQIPQILTEYSLNKIESSTHF
jgi:hypothetical protein